MASGREGLAAPEEERPELVERHKDSKRVALRSVVGRADRGQGLVGERVVVGGWVRYSKWGAKRDVPSPPVPPVADAARPEVLVSSRVPILRSITRLLFRANAPPLPRKKTIPSVAYLRINDGSCLTNLQVVVDSSVFPLGQIMATGTSILVEGVILQPPPQAKHGVELKVEKVLHVGVVDLKKYPLAETLRTLDLIRDYPHLRARTTTIASINRIRNSLSYSTHMFFQDNGFLYVQMPIITTIDPRVRGKVFQGTNLFSKLSDNEIVVGTIKEQDTTNLEAVRAAIKEKSSRIEKLKRSDSNKEVLTAALQDLQKTNELSLLLEMQQRTASIKAGKVDFSKDFFSRPVYLSFSAGLHLESYACALSSVYTFGPTFQAEDSQPAKHLAESWLIEVELAFAELEDVISCAEDYLKFLYKSVLANSSDDINFLSRRVDNNSVDRIQLVGSSPFARITYTEALEVLKKASNITFQTKIKWGTDLSSEHERYLAEEIYKRPVIIHEYPKEVKPFYVRMKDDGRTVSAFNIIAPKVGVLIRGSQKEERFDMINRRIQELSLPREQWEWYMDLRRHGTVKHSGFNLRLEDMVMFVTGLKDVRDTIPFPRTRGYAHC